MSYCGRSTVGRQWPQMFGYFTAENGVTLVTRLLRCVALEGSVI